MKKELLDFIEKCNKSNVSNSEMYDFIKNYTNNFDKRSFDYLKSDLNQFAENIEFRVYPESKNKEENELFEFYNSGGAVYCYEIKTNIRKCIETAKKEATINSTETVSRIVLRYITKFTATPRGKIEYVIHTIRQKYVSFEIFKDNYIGFLRFSDMVETEFKGISNPEPQQGTSEPPEKRFNLTNDQIELLYKKLIDKKAPYINTSLSNFKAICNGATPFDRIVWIHKNKRGKANKTSLNCLCRVLMNIETNPPKKPLNELFKIEGVDKIVLKTPSKRDKDTFDKYIRTFTNAMNPPL